MENNQGRVQQSLNRFKPEVRFSVRGVAAPDFLPIPIEDRKPLCYRAPRLWKHGSQAALTIVRENGIVLLNRRPPV
ncbi:hypothetical protein [Burkholderia pyrrocinia]|uniref:hypothetical protein n=1 Tax=Burkholderia pyrrocinia TaxID=60550 RepID=UPI0011E4DF76|nr:hypothetical protein [Burkholderia pyrrocinia]